MPYKRLTLVKGERMGPRALWKLIEIMAHWNSFIITDAGDGIIVFEGDLELEEK
jgi:hypothetical protein